MDRVDLVQIHQGGDYSSEFEYDSEADRKREKRRDLAEPEKSEKTKLPEKLMVTTEYERQEKRVHRYHVLSLDTYARHKKFINDYLLYYGGSRTEFQRDTSRDKKDIDVIREHHQFLWSEEDQNATWEKRLAKKYYDKLFKEYCITDLSRYKENKIAMRWRTDKEVAEGKGQFVCGNKTCEENEALKSWEVNFGYVEQGQKKNALVKLRLCSECSYKLNYRHRKKEVHAKKRKSNPGSTDSTGGKKRKREHTTKDAGGKATEGSERTAGESQATSGGSDVTEKPSSEKGDVWKAPVVEEKTQDDEFEEYFEDMFL